MQHVDVVDVPPVAFVGCALLPPVDREVRPGLRVWGHVIGGLRAKLLESTSGHEAVAREHIRAHEAARIEVVMFVPTVVRNLEALVRLDHCE